MRVRLPAVLGAGIIVSTLVVPACGGSSSAPTPTLQSIAIAIATELFLGSTEQATATGTLSNGTTQTVTGTWSSDDPTVAAVDSTGRVMAARSGRATIIFQSQGGLGGSRLTRVVPRYEGVWVGTYRIASCVESGDFIGEGVCDVFPPGTVLQAGMGLTQSPRTVIQGFFVLGGLESNDFTGSIAVEGTVAFEALVPLEQGLSIATSWQIDSMQGDRITGRFDEVWQGVGLSGQILVSADELDLRPFEAAAPLRTRAGTMPRTVAEAVAAIRQRR